MDTTQENRFNKEYILSLPFEDGVKHIFDIINNDMICRLNKEDVTDKDKQIVKFLSEDCFKQYINSICVSAKREISKRN